jgi:raffinose/stachyose/melibiose transport system substrate-binding protein
MHPFRRSLICLLLVSVFFLSAVPRSTQAQSTELTLAIIQYEGEGVQMVENVVTDFEAANPGVNINIEVRSVDAHKEALRVSLNTPAAPDIYAMWAGIGLGFFYVQSGGVESLDTYYEQYNWEERFLPSALAAAQIDGTYYGVPYSVRAMGLYYRTDLFRTAGIESIPTSYDELMAANAKLVEAGITPLSVGGKFGWNTMRLLDSLVETKCGAELHDQLKAMEASWAEEPCVTEAFQELRAWVDNGYLPQDFLGIEPSEAKIPVYQNRAAMQYEGDWFVGTLRTDEQPLENYDFFVFPTGTERLSFFTEMLWIAKNSENKDLAAKFIDYFTSPEVQTKYLGTLTTVSPTVGVEPETEREALDQKWVDALANYSAVYFPADQAFPNEITSFYFKVQDDVIAGALAPEEAGARLQQEIDRYKAANN